MNILSSLALPEGPPCPRVEGRGRIASEYRAYLSDESRIAAEPVEVIFFPENVGHVCQAVTECARKDMPATVAGARTGIVGGAVPVESRAVVSLERLNHIGPLSCDEREQCFLLNVEAGVILSDFQGALHNTPPRDMPWADETCRLAGMRILEPERRRLFYPVDPTETSAQIGGTLATNASGARTFHYGPTRRWVEAITVVLASGEILRLRRGQAVASEGRFILQTAGGSQTAIPIPRLQMPKTKHAAGYFLAQDMDAVDLFIGSEGTLGIIAEATLRLILAPRERLFMTALMPSESDALGFVQQMRRAVGLTVLAIEYFSPEGLALLRSKREEQGESSGVPALDGSARCAVYVEVAFEDPEGFRERYGLIEGLLAGCGASPRKTWAGFSTGDMEAMKAFRHALPEHVNTIIARRKIEVPALHKVGTDMAVPDESLEDVISLYRSKLAESGLEFVIFGHVGDNHLHVNILPRSEGELARAKSLYETFARGVVAMGGSVSAEHGIGRIKKSLLLLQYGPEKLGEMQAIKQALDPRGLLNPGVMF